MRIVGRELDRGVEPVDGRIGLVEGLGIGEVDFADAIVAAPLAPARRGFAGGGQQTRPIDQQQRLALDADVARIAQIGRRRLDEGEIVRRRVLLAISTSDPARPTARQFSFASTGRTANRRGSASSSRPAFPQPLAAEP